MRLIPRRGPDPRWRLLLEWARTSGPRLNVDVPAGLLKLLFERERSLGEITDYFERAFPTYAPEARRIALLGLLQLTADDQVEEVAGLWRLTSAARRAYQRALDQERARKERETRRAVLENATRIRAERAAPADRDRQFRGEPVFIAARALGLSIKQFDRDFLYHGWKQPPTVRCFHCGVEIAAPKSGRATFPHLEVCPLAGPQQEAAAQ